MPVLRTGADEGQRLSLAKRNDRTVEMNVRAPRGSWAGFVVEYCTVAMPRDTKAHATRARGPGGEGWVHCNYDI